MTLATATKSLIGIVTGAGRERRDYGEVAASAGEQGVAVRRSLCDLACADHIACAWAMLDHDRLPELRREDLRCQASREVERAAGRSRHDDLDRLRWLRPCGVSRKSDRTGKMPTACSAFPWSCSSVGR